MASTEKELELEGHTLPTGDLLLECVRLLDVARAQTNALRAEGVDTKHIMEADQMREQVAKEAARVESKPPKQFTPTKEQEKLLTQAHQWRAALVRKADRAFLDERHARLKYHRHFMLFGALERMYEELYLLWHHAKADQKLLAKMGVDQAFLNLGEDLCYQLCNVRGPDRAAMKEYDAKVATQKWGPAPVKPPPAAPLPVVPDNAKALSILKGRLHLLMKNLSLAGLAAYSVHAEKDAEKAAQHRRDFTLRVKPAEEDDDLLNLGKPSGPAPAPPTPTHPPAASPAASPPPTASVDILKKPPPRAVGLVRPSATTGSKQDR